MTYFHYIYSGILSLRLLTVSQAGWGQPAGLQVTGRMHQEPLVWPRSVPAGEDPAVLCSSSSRVPHSVQHVLLVETNSSSPRYNQCLIYIRAQKTLKANLLF